MMQFPYIFFFDVGSFWGILNHLSVDCWGYEVPEVSSKQNL